MKKIFILVLLLATGCGNQKVAEIDSPELCNCATVDNCDCNGLYRSINYDDAKELLENKDTVLIDVRTVNEYRDGHIENAISIPLAEINLLELPKDTDIIVYCLSGGRSKKAALELINLGYENVYDFGSINNWVE